MTLMCLGNLSLCKFTLDILIQGNNWSYITLDSVSTKNILQSLPVVIRIFSMSGKMRKLNFSQFVTLLYERREQYVLYFVGMLSARSFWGCSYSAFFLPLGAPVGTYLALASPGAFLGRPRGLPAQHRLGSNSKLYFQQQILLMKTATRW